MVSVFSILVDGVVVVTPREPFSFELVDFHLPFALNEGILSATLWNTESNVLRMVVGNTEVRKLIPSKTGRHDVGGQGTSRPDL